MSFYCNHLWDEVRRVYSKAALKSFESPDVDEEFLERILLGVTSIELRCVKCKKLNHHTVTGDMT